MLSTVKLKYPHTDGSIGIVPWLEDLPSLLQSGIYADIVLHPKKEENIASGNYINLNLDIFLYIITYCTKKIYL